MMTYDELRGWVCSACADLSMNSPQGGLGQYNDSVADDIYNDAETMADVIGDHICGEPNRDDLLCAMLDDNGTMRKAAEIIIDRIPHRPVKKAEEKGNGKVKAKKAKRRTK